jgi:hypothetical protein
MDDIHLREERTIKSWTNRKNALDECFQYVIFEKSSKEVFLSFFQLKFHITDEILFFKGSLY